jgi:hypothetical protein
MTSVCCYFDQGLLHLLRWWFSSPGGVLPLIHRLSCVGVVSFCAPPLYPTMFYRADVIRPFCITILYYNLLLFIDIFYILDMILMLFPLLSHV